MKIKSFIIVAFLIATFSLPAQKMELGIMGGLSLYSGDLSPSEFGLYFNDLHLAGGIFARYSPAQAISFRLAYEYTTLAADDKTSGRPSTAHRGFNFRSKLSETSLILEWNIAHLGRENGVQFVPYLFGGGAMFSFNPKGKLQNDWIELQPLGTEGQGLPGYTAPYELTQFSVPMGGGFKLNLNKTVILGFEFGGRLLFTDYLDDVSSSRPVSYFEVRDGNGDLAAHFSKPDYKESEDIIYTRGGKFNDWYYIGNVTLSFRIGDRGGILGGKRGQGIGCPGTEF